MRAAVRDAEPEAVYHLAARAHVGESWREPEAYLRDNLAMTLHLLEAVRAEAPEAAVVVVGSSELYGPPATLPVDESAPLRPQNPYAVSKASADLLAGFYADAHGLRIVRARAFNHAGPGQEPIYAIASFARQLAAGLEAGEIRCGRHRQPRRAARLHRRARRRARVPVRSRRARRRGSTTSAPGGRRRRPSWWRRSAGCAGVGVSHEVDPKLRRAHEVMEVRGSYERLHGATGWEPEIPLEQTLADTVAWWREEIRAGRAGARVHE